MQARDVTLDRAEPGDRFVELAVDPVEPLILTREARTQEIENLATLSHCICLTVVGDEGLEPPTPSV
jgi:hypothetical protein